MKLKIFFIFLLFSLANQGYTQISQVWLRSFGLNNGSEVPTCLKQDNSGNLYISGFGYNKAYLIKYDPEGNLLWSFSYNSFQSSRFNDITFDNTGNVYVTGHGDSTATMDDFLTIKFSESGVVQWVAKYDDPGHRSQRANAIAIDTLGNVYVTGQGEDTSNTADDYITIKYDSNGNQQWVRRYVGAGTAFFDWAKDIALDSQGNVFVTGYSSSTDNTVTIKYDSDGNQQWIKSFYTTANSNEFAKVRISIDNNDDIIVLGQGNFNFTIVKYDNSGNILWDLGYTPPNTTYPAPNDLFVDDNGFIYVTGSNNIYGRNLVTIKVSPSGQLNWANIYPGEGSLGNDIFVDNEGYIYVTGFSEEQELGGLEFDYLTIKYSSSGTIIWKMLYNGTGNSLDWAWGIGADNIGNVYITGESIVSDSQTDIVTIKYSKSSGIQILSNELPQKFSLSQNYPNPFNPSTNIEFEIAKATNVKLVVYDALGREVKVLAEESMQPGIYNANFDAENLSSGIYFYTLMTSEFTETKRMVLLK